MSRGYVPSGGSWTCHFARWPGRKLNRRKFSPVLAAGGCTEGPPRPPRKTSAGTTGKENTMEND